jgi:hypothetical protein
MPSNETIQFLNGLLQLIKKVDSDSLEGSVNLTKKL